MKFDRNKVFPYPVLRPFSDDYLESEFQVAVEMESDGTDVKVGIIFRVSCDELLEEVKIGNAGFVATIACRETYHREVVTSSESKFSIRFGDGQLRGEVRVDGYIVALKKINEFRSSDINPEFGKDSFQYTPGDVLAQVETTVFFIDKDLFKPVTSVFDLVSKESLAPGEWSVGTDEDHVQIQVSPSLKESIDGARNNNHNRVVLLNSIYFSAVVHVIQRLKEMSDEYEARKWSRVIFRQLHNMGLDLYTTDSYVLAQRLMKFPLAALNHYVLKGSE